MAAKKGKTTKKAGTKGKKAQNSYSFRDEIIILLTLAVAILLILSNFGLGGFLGNAVSAFLFGIFGLPAYIMPVLLFLGTAFVFSNRGNSFAYIKLGAGVGFSSALFYSCLLFHLKKSRLLFPFTDMQRRRKRAADCSEGFLQNCCARQLESRELM